MTRAFICIYDNCLFFLLNFYRNDLVLECAGLLSSLCLLLAYCSELVQFFSCKTPLIADVLSCDTHVVVVECIPESIVNHCIN